MLLHNMKSLTQASSRLSMLMLTITVLTCLSHRASAQSGFLSIDCGAPAAYDETVKGISWLPDGPPYIHTGTPALTNNTSIDPRFSSHLLHLRFFPDARRTRFCYALPTTPNKKLLLRAIFYHGGYDNNPVVKFDVGVDIFDTRVHLSFNVEYDYDRLEWIFQSFRESVQFCLFRTAATDHPFISSLEIRPLDDGMYAGASEGALFAQTRYDFGPTGSELLRYPDDPYDRFWTAPTLETGLQRVTGITTTKYTGYAVDKAPPSVMNTAMTLAIGYGPAMSSIFYPSFSKNPLILNLFFSELQTTNGPLRMFDILFNGVLWASKVNIYALAQNNFHVPIELSTNSSTVDANGALNVTLVPSAGSTTPPIWNAAELYSVHAKKAATLASDAGAIDMLKKAFGLALQWTGDPCLLIPYDWLTCSATSPPRIIEVKLSSAGLTGSIPDLSALTSLTILRLDNNKLTGEVPGWLASLPNLKELYLQNNNLEGQVPSDLLKLPVIRLEGNPNLCLNTTCPKKKVNNVMIIVGVSVGAFVGLGVVVAIIVVLCCCCKKGKDQNNTLPYSVAGTDDGPSKRGPLIDEGTTKGCRYTLAQVMTATKNNSRMLGKGGFGPVYYGKLASGQEVAVKVSDKGSNQGSKEFINEVELLTRVHHKNLVSLVGYCDEGDNLMLLYEFMSKGTVQEHLYGVGAQKKNSVLDWKTRLQIALNSAQGLEYLHVGCNPVIYHRDVKSNNILLNDKMIAKVADFGLSKSTDMNDNVTHMSTMVKGTIGYLDPEYYMSNQLTDKSDVYSFGVVLLELICARPPFIPQLPKEQQLLDKWVRPHLQNGTVEEVVDPALAGQYSLDAMWKVADLAMQSVEPRGKHRPTMSTIVHELRAVLELENGASGVAPTRPPSQGSSSGFRFDMIQSSSSISDPQFGPSTVQAR